MNRKQALAELIAKVEAGEWPGKNVLHEINDTYGFDAWRAYDGSLDAAKLLHEAVLPGWFGGVSENIHGHGWYGWVQTNERHMDARSDNPARAWLLAILRALHSMEPEA